MSHSCIQSSEMYCRGICIRFMVKNSITTRKLLTPSFNFNQMTEEKGFSFQEKGHKYFLDGKAMTGVTTILGVIAKPMLIQWAANMAVGYIDERLENIGKNYSGVEMIQHLADELPNILQEAKSAHRKKKEDAGDKGKDVHAQIEVLIKSSLDTGTPISGSSDNEQVQHFIDWAVSNKVKFLVSEEKVFSRKLWVAGTIDFVCEIDGEVWIGDIKTSSAIYPEHFFQTAGYQKLMEDMADDDGGMPVNVKGHIILNVRKDNTFEEKRSISNLDNLSAFMAALTLYRVQEKVKDTIL